MNESRLPLRDRLLEALADAVEHGCKVTKKQLDERCWGWATNAAAVTDDLASTFLRVSILEGEIGPGGGHPDAITGGLTVPVAPSEEALGA